MCFPDVKEVRLGAAPRIDEAPISIAAHLAGWMNILVIIEIESLSAKNRLGRPQLLPKDRVFASPVIAQARVTKQFGNVAEIHGDRLIEDDRAFGLRGVLKLNLAWVVPASKVELRRDRLQFHLLSAACGVIGDMNWPGRIDSPRHLQRLEKVLTDFRFVREHPGNNTRMAAVALDHLQHGLKNELEGLRIVISAEAASPREPARARLIHHVDSGFVAQVQRFLVGKERAGVGIVAIRPLQPFDVLLMDFQRDSSAS